jgi:hypothetical protein
VEFLYKKIDKKFEKKDDKTSTAKTSKDANASTKNSQTKKSLRNYHYIIFIARDEKQ